MRRMLLAIVITSFIPGMCIASQNFNADYNQSSYTSEKSLNVAQKNNAAIKDGVITVPAGESFRAVFMASISSETASAGQEITLALPNDFYYGNVLVAPAGSSITGTVIESSKAKHGSLNGKLTLRFTHILTPAGFDIPISALIKTADGTGTLIGGQSIVFATGNISPESIGAKDFVPPYLGVRPGTNAAMTTAVETGGGGLLKSIWDKGEEVEISVNSGVDLILTQPITITPLASQNK